MSTIGIVALIGSPVYTPLGSIDGELGIETTGWSPLKTDGEYMAESPVGNIDSGGVAALGRVTAFGGKTVPSGTHSVGIAPGAVCVISLGWLAILVVGQFVIGPSGAPMLVAPGGGLGAATTLELFTMLLIGATSGDTAPLSSIAGKPCGNCAKQLSTVCSKIITI